MDRVIIRPHRLEESVEYRPVAGTLRVNPAGRWPWLQRKLFGVLRRLGASPQTERIVRYTAVEIRLDDLFRAVCESEADLMRIHRKQARYLVVGADVYRRIVKSEPHYFAFAVPPSYEASVHDGHRRRPQVFAGLVVVMVPWVDGLFVLPEIDPT